VITGNAKGSMVRYQSSDFVASKPWLAYGDERIGPECQRIQDVRAVVSELNVSTGHRAPPVHPNCRCVLQPTVVS